MEVLASYSHTTQLVDTGGHGEGARFQHEPEPATQKIQHDPLRGPTSERRDNSSSKGRVLSRKAFTIRSRFDGDAMVHIIRRTGVAMRPIPITATVNVLILARPGLPHMAR